MHAQAQISINIRPLPNCRRYLSLKNTCKFTMHRYCRTQWFNFDFGCTLLAYEWWCTLHITPFLKCFDLTQLSNRTDLSVCYHMDYVQRVHSKRINHEKSFSLLGHIYYVFSELIAIHFHPLFSIWKLRRTDWIEILYSGSVELHAIERSGPTTHTVDSSHVVSVKTGPVVNGRIDILLVSAWHCFWTFFY